MKKCFSSMSLQAKLSGCILLISFLLVVISTLLLREALMYNDRMERIVQISQCTEHLILAIKELAFERGRTNVVLATEMPITQNDRNFIESRRRLADEHMAIGLGILERIDPIMADEGKNHYTTFLKMRETVDSAVGVTAAEKVKQIRAEWFRQSTAFIYQLKSIIEVLGKKEMDSGFFFRYHQLQINSVEFRLLTGQSASILTAALNKPTPMTPDEYQEFIETRAKADYVWSRIETSVADFKNDAIANDVSQAYKAYYNIYRPIQEEMVHVAFTEKVPVRSVEQLKELSVPALDSIFALADTANAETLAYVQTKKNKADMILKVALLQFFMGLLIVAFTIGYFRSQLFQPLKQIINALKSISVGEAVPSLDDEAKRQDEIGQLFQGVKMLQESMNKERRLKELNERLAMTDTLTGCLNRRAFYQRSKMEINRAIRDNRNFAFAIIDVDNMKYINDAYGHIIGDEMLKHLTKIISDSCRTYDLIGRFGGDEFMALIQAASNLQIQETIGRIHTAIQESPLIVDSLEEHLYLNISIGVVFGGGDKEKPLDWFIQQADIALYQAKKRGKNDIVFISDESA